MSHFDAITARARRVRGDRARHRRRPSPRSRTSTGASTACSSTPRWCTPPRGQEILEHFLYDVCRLPADVDAWRRSSSSRSRRSAPRSATRRCICGLSGGVDSAVAAALVHKAVGDQLTCVFVDTGLMRHGEAEQVEETFRRPVPRRPHPREGGRPVPRSARRRDRPGEEAQDHRRDCSSASSRRSAADCGDAQFLVQGTLYPDVIESGTEDAAKIKSHHNVGGLPDDMDFELVEPLRHLFKDEVRAVGEELGLPDDIVWRQPFPGPGLAVRIVGDDHARARRDPAQRRRRRRRGDQAGRARPRAVAELRRAAGGAVGRRDGRRAHLRVSDRHPGRHVRRRDDRRLGPPALRPARADLVAASSTRSPV